MHSLEIENYKKKIKLNDRQRYIIVGKLLGDGHLETNDNGKTYRLKIEHSIKQKEYVDWLFKELRPLIGLKNPFTRQQRTYPPQGGSFLLTSYGFATFSLGALRFYGQQFYDKKGRKIMPKLIHKLLSPESLALWYLDDGSFKSNKHRTFIIHSYGYAKSDLRRVQEVLRRRYGIKTNIHRQRKNDNIYWRLYVVSESAPRFKELVEPIIAKIPSMQYKLGNIMPKK